MRAFEHDHARLAVFVLALRDSIQSVRRHGRQPEEIHSALSPHLDDLREALLSHFAREEEALFPFIAEQLPDLGDAVARLQSSHDLICGTVLRMSHVWSAEPRASAAHLAQLLELFGRFEVAYAAHARDERDVLQAAGSRLGEDHRRALAALMEGL